jgi:uracil-DNA glycosylase
MSDEPIDLVINALRQAQASGANPRASHAALSRLQSAVTAAPVVDAKRQPPPTPRPVPESGSFPTAKLEEAAVRPAAQVTDGSKAAKLAALRAPVLACTLCPHLVKSRTQVVFGVGNPDAELMFIGEAPGADEDLVGEPFVGKAGQLLTKIIETMGFRRADVYIANILKCRPDMPAGESGNRKPTAAEMETCKPYLLQQVEIIQPRLIVALGATAVAGLLRLESPIGKLRGTWQEFQRIPVMPTFHPSYLLRNQSLTEKRKVWEDMLLVLERLGRPITERQRGFFLKGG